MRCYHVRFLFPSIAVVRAVAVAAIPTLFASALAHGHKAILSGHNNGIYAVIRVNASLFHELVQTSPLADSLGALIKQ